MRMIEFRWLLWNVLHNLESHPPLWDNQRYAEPDTSRDKEISESDQNHVLLIAEKASRNPVEELESSMAKATSTASYGAWRGVTHVTSPSRDSQRSWLEYSNPHLSLSPLSGNDKPIYKKCPSRDNVHGLALDERIVGEMRVVRQTIDTLAMSVDPESVTRRVSIPRITARIVQFKLFQTAKRETESDPNRPARQNRRGNPNPQGSDKSFSLNMQAFPTEGFHPAWWGKCSWTIQFPQQFLSFLSLPNTSKNWCWSFQKKKKKKKKNSAGSTDVLTVLLSYVQAGLGLWICSICCQTFRNSQAIQVEPIFEHSLLHSDQNCIQFSLSNLEKWNFVHWSPCDVHVQNLNTDFQLLGILFSVHADPKSKISRGHALKALPVMYLARKPRCVSLSFVLNFNVNSSSKRDVMFVRTSFPQYWVP